MTFATVLALALCSASSSAAFQKLSKTTGMPSGFSLDVGDYFGQSVTSLGDLDGDGVSDLAVGASGDDDAGTINSGAVYVVLMNANGTGKAFQKLSQTTGMPSGFSLDNSDYFGQSVTSLGDLDGDGVSDLAVGAFADDDGGTNTGAVYVVLMNANGSGKAFQKLSQTTGMPSGFSLDNYDLFGSSVTSLGDLDGDGVPDFAVGATGDEINGGAIYVTQLVLPQLFSFMPTSLPTIVPTLGPSMMPTMGPSTTLGPTLGPTLELTLEPTSVPVPGLVVESGTPVQAVDNANAGGDDDDSNSNLTYASLPEFLFWLFVALLVLFFSAGLLLCVKAQSKQKKGHSDDAKDGLALNTVENSPPTTPTCDLYKSSTIIDLAKSDTI